MDEKKLRIRFFGVHRRAHLDELVMLAMARSHGWRRWFWRKERPPELVVFDGDEDIVKRGAVNNDDIVFLGCGGGLKERCRGIVIDEHAAEGCEVNACGTLLLARYLGLEESPEYKAIIAEVLRSDVSAGQQHLELGQLIKVLYGWGRNVDEARVGRFVHNVVNALRRQARGDAPRRQPITLSVALGDDAATLETIGQVKRIVLPAYAPLATLLSAFMALQRASPDCQIRLAASQADVERYDGRDDVLFVGIESGQVPPKMNLKKTAKKLRLDQAAGFWLIVQELERWQREEQRLFELGHVVDALNAHSGVEATVIWEQVARIFGAIIRRAKELFEDCPKAFEAAGGWVYDVGEVKVAFVDSELGMMATYCRNVLKAKVVVLRNLATKQTQIFTAKGYGHLIVPIMAEVLRAEAAHAGIAADSLERRLGRFAKMAAEKRDGPLPGFEHWYVMLGGGMALNGSHTRDVPATKISAQVLVFAVVNGVRASQGPPPVSP